MKKLFKIIIINIFFINNYIGQNQSEKTVNVPIEIKNKTLNKNLIHYEYYGFSINQPEKTVNIPIEIENKISSLTLNKNLINYKYYVFLIINIIYSFALEFFFYKKCFQASNMKKIFDFSKTNIFFVIGYQIIPLLIIIFLIMDINKNPINKKEIVDKINFNEINYHIINHINTVFSIIHRCLGILGLYLTWNDDWKCGDPKCTCEWKNKNKYKDRWNENWFNKISITIYIVLEITILFLSIIYLYKTYKNINFQKIF